LRALVGTRRFEAALSAARRLRGSGGPAWPDAHLLALQMASPQVSIALACRDLGYAPQFDFAAGLAEIRAVAG
jgi:nucleoside-diphosphate-sugar epimerase